ncbi:MAG: type II toxin-antitoxin system RelE/ParE family toxin [Erysipelotrichaceae bacterium]|nr:type II toxin-antitoxin system RelE/ParE family toxin [Erysipelotrichaceae bacterium]
MDYKIIISEKAENDLRNIFYYNAIDLQNPRYATRIYQKLLENIADLSFVPERFRSCLNTVYHDEISLRVMIVDKYKVIYLVNKIDCTVTIYYIIPNKLDTVGI